MSAWERSRYIPWERIPKEATNLDEQKEKIFRDLQRESIQDELLLQGESRKLQPGLAAAAAAAASGSEDAGVVVLEENTSTTDSASSGSSSPTSTHKQTKPAYPYSNMELMRQAAFGATIGSITGGVFGFMDGMRTVGEQRVLKHASNMAKGRYIFQGTTRSATLFGVFFGGFQILKYGCRVALNDPGEVTEIALAGMTSLGALVVKPTYRSSMPYAAMLILMDGAQLVMRKTS